MDAGKRNSRNGYRRMIISPVASRRRQRSAQRSNT